MKVSIEIPNTLKDIKLRQYQRYLKIDEPNDMDLLVCMLDSDKNTLKNLKSSEFERIAGNISQMFNEKHDLTRIINVNGVKMGLIPDFDEITYGENKDITTYLNDWEQMHRAMSVLYRPIKQKIGNKYLINEYKGTRLTANAMLDMPLDVVFGVIVFFWTLTSELLSYIPSYLEKEMGKKGLDSVKNGEVMKKLQHSLKETLEEMEKLQGYHFTLVTST